ncbi:hypothetical protein SteCoe_3719 [Stentor coeruleus]|uniref:Myosin motor domain-containing protein n=1 Tax=Stentor coeruleus TaxID=5963 RepID=A0A1R2CWK8_9CILI|nr:hypothetical protein SteCoe_3719 [Stentor coeruleus]
MESLKENKLQDAFRMLQKAEEMLKFPDGNDFTKLLAITNNNLGCYYKRIQKLPLALEYLFKALKVEIHNVYDKSNLAGTHLNICAVYSLMNQHEKALGHGVLAIKILKEAYDEDKETKTLTSLIVALNNTGFEYELLKDYEGAQNVYKNGLDLAGKNLGYEHPVTLALAKAYKNIMLVKSEKPSKKSSFVKKNDVGKLPKIKSFTGRNRSLGSNTRFFSSENDNSSSRGYKTNSNKTFDEKVATKKHLPKIEKTVTVSKRSKKILEVSKIHSLEEKITELQNQIAIYQQKYKQLEEKSLKPKLDKTAAAIKIQRFWRKKYKTKPLLLPPVIPTETKAKKSKKELNQLKNQPLKDHPHNQTKISPASFKISKNNVISFHAQKNYGNNRIQRKIVIPLYPIRESKIETKEMKAILIQSSIRGFLARKRYEKMKHSAIKIQSAYRRYQCTNLFRYIRNAVLTIQSKWRNYHKKSCNSPKKKTVI